MIRFLATLAAVIVFRLIPVGASTAAFILMLVVLGVPPEIACPLGVFVAFLIIGQIDKDSL